MLFSSAVYNCIRCEYEQTLLDVTIGLENAVPLSKPLLIPEPSSNYYIISSQSRPELFQWKVKKCPLDNLKITGYYTTCNIQLLTISILESNLDQYLRRKQHISHKCEFRNELNCFLWKINGITVISMITTALIHYRR